MEVLRALGALVQPPSEALSELAAHLELGALPSAADHTELFSFQLPPYASIYLGAEGRLGGDARDRIAGFWRVLDLRPPPDPDHLTTLLASYAACAEAGRGTDDADERRHATHRATAFLGDHLLSWLGLYLNGVRRIARGGFYRRWAELLWRGLEREAERLEPPPLPSQHHRLSQPLGAGDVESVESLTRALLVPIRSGLLITRRDLARAARDLSLASRIGERRFMLQAMLDQSPSAVHRWLVEFAEEGLASHRAVDGPLSAFFAAWSERVAATLRALGSIGEL